MTEKETEQENTEPIIDKIEVEEKEEDRKTQLAEKGKWVKCKQEKSDNKKKTQKRNTYGEFKRTRINGRRKRKKGDPTPNYNNIGRERVQLKTPQKEALIKRHSKVLRVFIFFSL